GGGLPLVVERQVNVWLQPAERGEIFGDERMPVFVWHYTDVEAFYGLPGLHGEGVKVGFHHGGETGHPDLLSREAAPEEVERIRRLVRVRMPLLDGEQAGTGVCFYTNTPDGHFIIGSHPDAPDVIMAGGFSGHGFKFCPVVGEIIADLVVDRSTRHSIAPFAPARFLP
ncbi:MAG TPA: FAD-dependent oxidoreductase, partial [Bacillota bacterium]